MITLRQIYSFHPDGTDLCIDIDQDDAEPKMTYIKQGSDWVAVTPDKLQELSEALLNIWKST